LEEDGGSGERLRPESDVWSGAAFSHQQEKMRFAKAAEPNLNTESFNVAKVIERRSRTVSELEYLNGTPIDGQFYREELTPVRITDWTSYKIYKILDKRVRRGIREYVVRL